MLMSNHYLLLINISNSLPHKLYWVVKNSQFHRGDYVDTELLKTFMSLSIKLEREYLAVKAGLEVGAEEPSDDRSEHGYNDAIAEAVQGPQPTEIPPGHDPDVPEHDDSDEPLPF